MTGYWRASHGDLKEEQTPQLFNTPLARGGTKLPGGVTLITRSPAGGSAADASFKDPAASSPRAERSDVMRVHVRGRERATTPPPSSRITTSSPSSARAPSSRDVGGGRPTCGASFCPPVCPTAARARTRARLIWSSCRDTTGPRRRRRCHPGRLIRFLARGKLSRAGAFYFKSVFTVVVYLKKKKNTQEKPTARCQF